MAASNASIPTHILIISDSHNAPLSVQDENSPFGPVPFREPLPAADVLIHCGDMTVDGQAYEYHQTLDMLRRIDAPVKLCIAGNHDRTMDPVWMEANPHHLPKSLAERMLECQQARDLWISPTGRARREGVTFLEEGIHVVPLPNGAELTVCKVLSATSRYLCSPVSSL